MLKVEYLVLADYVRADNGVVHIMAAGIDTIQAPHVPYAKLIHAAIRISFDTDDPPGSEHTFKLIFMEEDQQRASIEGTFHTPDRNPDIPVHWRIGSLFNLAMSLPLPSYGEYGIELLLDGAPAAEAPLRVIPAEPAGERP